MKFIKNVFLSVAIFAFTLALVGFVSKHQVYALTCTSEANGDWSDVATWDAGCNDGTIPASIDDVVVAAGHVVTVDAGNPTVNSITIEDPAAAGATGVVVATGQTLSVGPGHVVYTANTGALAQSITLNGTGTLSVGGNFTIAAPAGAGNSSLVCTDGTGTQFSTTALTITGNSTSTGKASVAMNDCTMVAEGLVTIDGGTNATGVAEITSTGGALNFNAGLTFVADLANAQLTTSSAADINLTGTLTGAGTLSLAEDTILKTYDVTAINAVLTTWKDMQVVSGTTTLGAAQTVTGLQVDSGATLAAGANLITNTGTGTGVNGFTVNGTLSGSGGATLSGIGATINGTGTYSNTGTLTLTGAKTIASTAVLTFPGTVALSAATTVTNNGTITTTGAGGITGANGTTSIWTQGADSTLNFGGATDTLLSTGVLNASATGNTVNYNLTGAQTVKEPATSYYNLTLSGTGEKVIGSGQTVAFTTNIGTGASTDLTGNTTTRYLRFAGALKRAGSWGFTGSGAGHIETVFMTAGAGTITSAKGPTGYVVSGGGGSSDTSSDEDEEDTTPSPVEETPDETTAQGCSGGNKYNTQTGALCVNAVAQAAIEGCSNRTTGFSTSSGKSCVGNIVSAAATTGVYNFGTVTLKSGSSGSAVMELQKFLNAKSNAGLMADGKFGPKTSAAVKAWQASKGLTADGLFGSMSRAKAMQ